MALVNPIKNLYNQYPPGLWRFGATVVTTLLGTSYWLGTKIASSDERIKTLIATSRQTNQNVETVANQTNTAIVELAKETRLILEKVSKDTDNSWFKMNKKIDDHTKIEDKRYEQLSSRLREDVRTSTLSSVLAGAGVSPGS